MGTRSIGSVLLLFALLATSASPGDDDALYRIAYQGAGTLPEVEIRIGARPAASFRVDPGRWVSTVGREQAALFGISGTAASTSLDRVVLGELVISDTPFQIVDEPEGSRSDVLGMSFFNGLLVRFDFEERSFSVHGGALPATDNESILDWTEGDDRTPRIPVLLNGRRFDCRLDLVAFGAVSFPASSRSDLELHEEPATVGFIKESDGSTLELKAARLKGLAALGSFELESPGIQFTSYLQEGTVDPAAFHLGGLTLDIANHRLRLEPRGQTGPLPHGAGEILTFAEPITDLETIFNADQDKVKLLMLLSPT